MAVNISKQMTNQEKEDYILKRLVYCSLLLEEYAYRELLCSPNIQGKNRHTVNCKLRYVKNQLLQFARDSGVSREAIKKSENMAIENVSLMALVMSSLAIVPECQVDFIEEEFTKIMVEAMQRFNNK